MAASGGTYGIKCDPDVSYQPDCYAQSYQYDQKLLQEPLSEMDLAGFLEMDDKMLSGMLYVYLCGCYKNIGCSSHTINIL